MRFHSRTLGALSLATATVLASSAMSAEPPRTQRQGFAPAPNFQQQQPQRVTANRPVQETMQSTDQTIAQWLALDNQLEVEMNKLAASKLEDRDVRQFAEQLIKDHGQDIAQLQRFGARVAAAETLTSNTDRQQPANPRPQAHQQQPGTRQAGAQEHFNFLEAKRRIGQQCLASARKHWDSKQGKHAEEAYLGHQIAAHEQMIDTATVLRDYASENLRGVIDKSIQEAQQHLDRAKQLMHEVVRGDKDLGKDRDSKDQQRTSDKSDK